MPQEIERLGGFMNAPVSGRARRFVLLTFLPNEDRIGVLPGMGAGRRLWARPKSILPDHHPVQPTAEPGVAADADEAA
jgi:hypothetical protein